MNNFIKRTYTAKRTQKGSKNNVISNKYFNITECLCRQKTEPTDNIRIHFINVDRFIVHPFRMDIFGCVCNNINICAVCIYGHTHTLTYIYCLFVAFFFPAVRRFCLLLEQYFYIFSCSSPVIN